MPRKPREEDSTQRVSLLLATSPQAAWENVIHPWFKKIATGDLRDERPIVVVTASRSQAYFVRSRLLDAGKNLLGVKFLSPPQLRELLLRNRHLNIPLREHLRLFLAIAAEEFASENSNNEGALVAKSIARDPDHLLRALDQIRAAGWSFEEIDAPALRAIAAQFEKQSRASGFTFAYDADRDAAQSAPQSPRLFSNLLLFGFDAAHWPFWPLLRAATLSSTDSTIILNDPRDEARDLDETWIGTWEETFGAVEIVPPCEKSTSSFVESLPIPESNIHFLVGRDTKQQAKAIVALAAKFLADPQCERLGILFWRPGALTRLVATFLQSAEIAHNDSIAHLAPSTFDDHTWRAWLELQEAPRLKLLFRFLRATSAEIFEKTSLSKVPEASRRGPIEKRFPMLAVTLYLKAIFSGRFACAT